MRITKTLHGIHLENIGEALSPVVRGYLSEQERDEILERGAPYITTTLLPPQTAINYTVVNLTAESDTDK